MAIMNKDEFKKFHNVKKWNDKWETRYQDYRLSMIDVKDDEEYEEIKRRQSVKTETSKRKEERNRTILNGVQVGGSLGLTAVGMIAANKLDRNDAIPRKTFIKGWFDMLKSRLIK